MKEKERESIADALAVAETTGELVTALLSIHRRVLRLECGTLLCGLHNDGSISLTSEENISSFVSLKNNEFWMIWNCLVDAIPELDCSHTEVIRLVHSLVERAGSDRLAGQPNVSLVKWCGLNPQKGKKIVLEAKALKQIGLEHCVFAIEGLADVELAFELVDNEEIVLVAVGLRSLGRLAVHDLNTAKRILDACYTSIHNDRNQDIRSAAIQTAFRTWALFKVREPYRQMEILVEIEKSERDTEPVQLAAMLSLHPLGLTSKSIEKIFTILAKESSNVDGVIHWLNSAICSRPPNFDFVSIAKVIEALLIKSDASFDVDKVHSFCEWVWEDSENISWLFSQWLLSPQIPLCSFLESMLSNREKNHPVNIKKKHLPENENDQVVIAKKCVGFLSFQEVSAASILLSIVKNGKKNAKELSELLLFDPLLLSYRGELNEFLVQQEKNASKRVSECVGRVLARKKTYLLGLETVDHLVEFIPSIEQRRTAAFREFSRNREIQNQAREKSDFLQLLSHETLLYGCKSFSMIRSGSGEDLPKVTVLTDVSYTFEYPKLYVIDPSGFDMQLFELKSVRRKEQ